ncbi:MAG TPA: SPFH domain-containing protein [Candidatus Nanoarchaeia archaeon]|nr:SPFH domain-containing protein [Candidatus Nanoarchaeia archaeon]
MGLKGKLSGKFVKGALGVGAGVLVGSCVYATQTTYIEPNEHAVRKDMWTISGEPGLSEGVADGGKLYASPTTKTSFIKFPRTPQVINFSNSQSDAKAVEEVEGFLNQPQLEVPSKDGYKNSFEMTVIYRITNPYLVTSKVGAGKAYQLEVGNRAKRVIFDTVGNLKAEELYDVDKRVPVLAEAQKALNDELTPNGITVDHLLLRKFSYSEDYEKILDDKVLQDQLRIAAEREKEAAQIEKLVLKAQEEGSQAVETEKTRATKISTERRAQADTLYEQRVQDGELEKQKVLAEGQRLVNKAYDGEGAGRVVGLIMASKAASANKHIYLRSCSKDGANPLDIESITKQLSGQ